MKTLVSRQPLWHILSKAFLLPYELPEFEVAENILRGLEYRNKSRRLLRYYLLRTGQADWRSSGCGNLPVGLTVEPRYWTTPWADAYRPPMTLIDWVVRRVSYPRLYRRFRQLILDMAESHECWVGPPVSGILLVDEEKDRQVFIVRDGHHRVGAFAAIPHRHHSMVPVLAPPEHTFDLKRTLRSGVRYGFSEDDSRRWWNHCFERTHQTE